MQQLIFKKFEATDFKDYFQLVSNEQVMAQITERAIPFEEAQVNYQKLLERNEKYELYGSYKVCDMDEFIGFGHLTLNENEIGEAEIGYMILPEYWGKGYGSAIIHVNLPIYLTIMFFIAIGNSGARVARNSFLMEWVSNDIIGRVDGVFRSIGLLLRVVLLAIFTGMVSSGLILYCFILLSGILFIASLAVFFTWKKGFETDRKELKCDILLTEVISEK